MNSLAKKVKFLFFFSFGAMLHLRCVFGRHDFTPTSAGTSAVCLHCGNFERR